jgi:beta-glucosidase
MEHPPHDIVSRFPVDFHWGVATSAYQIEGSTDADGRGACIWDTFVQRDGAIERGEDARVACDHYRRVDEDLALLRFLNVTSYRFSISWPRIQPLGAGAVNEAGVAFYDRLVDGLLEAGIRPFPTLYHWDLPQALEDTGGWTNRDTAERFAEYTGLVVARLGDRVRDWSLFNEPFIFLSRGYLTGRYAPGRKSLRDFLRSVHVVTLAHADGFRAAKAVRPDARVGSVFAMSPCEPATPSEEDRHAAEYADALFNHLFLSPLWTGSYPQAFLAGVPERALHIEPGDEKRMRAPLDFIGVNCYYRLIVSAGGDQRPDLPFFVLGLRSDKRSTGGHADFTDAAAGMLPVEGAFGRGQASRTEMGWEIWPQAMHDVALAITHEYGRVPIEICESGCAFADVPGADGVIRDSARTGYHWEHLRAVAAAIEAGANVRGYHVWTLYDNFEWASGYRPRFGLVHVDFATQRRTPKASAVWYREVCRAARVQRREKGEERSGNGERQSGEDGLAPQKA